MMECLMLCDFDDLWCYEWDVMKLYCWIEISWNVQGQWIAKVMGFVVKDGGFDRKIWKIRVGLIYLVF